MRDYEVEIWHNGEFIRSEMLYGLTEEGLACELDSIRAGYPGCNTEVFEIHVDGGTHTRTAL